LVALVDVMRSTRSISLAQAKKQWPLQRINRLMDNLKACLPNSVVVPFSEPRTGVLTYPDSTDCRPDVDGLSPVQVGECSASTEHHRLINMTGIGLGRHRGY
jgi:hypothetical protein